ncbi:unnamed protein product [Diamesa serratosioi]
MANNELIKAIDEYKAQLLQVTMAINITTDESEKENLNELRTNLEELIILTEESIVSDPKDELDSEMELFRREIENLEGNSSEEVKNNFDEIDFEELINKKCSAQFGSNFYHNAFISSVDKEESIKQEKVMVKLVFTNPMYKKMCPCPYYLDSTCKFSDEDCRYSHFQELFDFNGLEEYREPDYKLIKINCLVLAKEESGLWSRGTVKSYDPEKKQCQVQLTCVKKELNCDYTEILPLDNEEDSDEESDGFDNEVAVNDTKETFESSFKTTGESFGDWEQFTKGIGSKLMAKMGYEKGKSLGIRGHGIITPITTQLLPQGKSLDYCMNLRERCNGDENFFSVDRKMKRKQRHQTRKNKTKNDRRHKKEADKDVFSFINVTLCNNTAAKVPEPQKATPVTNLKEHTNKQLNVSCYQLGENIKKIEKEIEKLKMSLTRHEQTDSTPIYSSIKQQIATKSLELAALQNTEKSLNKEMTTRKDKTKLTIF